MTGDETQMKQKPVSRNSASFFILILLIAPVGLRGSIVKMTPAAGKTTDPKYPPRIQLSQRLKSQ